jgi:glycosyltransferase involved in cell wall biosynthesis
MITYNRPEYTRLALKSLLDTCDDAARVWVWHNGNHAETLNVVNEFRAHPRFHRFHHSVENRKLNEPTNWLWLNSSGDYVGKVDDDCLVPKGWIEALCRAHEANPQIGVLGCWHYREGDVSECDLEPRLIEVSGHRILRNTWIGGSGYLMKRACVSQQGLLKSGQSFTDYCIRLAASGRLNGWYYPFIYQDHMDDPRSSYTAIRSDAEVRLRGGLTARRRGLDTIQSVLDRQQAGLREILTSSLDPRDFIGWRATSRRFQKRLRKFVANSKVGY